MKQKILSLLVLLMTAATGAWAQNSVQGDVNFPATKGTWTFDDGTTAGTGNATLAASDGVTFADGAATVPVNEKLSMTTNAGGDLTTYTFMMDVKILNDSERRFTALFQTILDRDADLFIYNHKTDGRKIGINSNGMGFGGSIDLNEWYRVVFSCTDAVATVYVDGVKVAAATSANTDIWTMHDVAYFFADNDGEENEISCDKICFWNVALTEAQAALLGGVGTEIPTSDDIEVTPVAGQQNQWEFDMPGSDMLLTPIYAAATIYESDGQTEKQAYETLKDAFAAVQSGDIIKLDWNVTLTEDLKTPTTGSGIEFTIDFNGFTLDLGNYKIYLQKGGDQLTFTDSKDGEMGGLKGTALSNEVNTLYIFEAGRYNFGDMTAEQINTITSSGYFLALAPGKEFIDLEGGAAANDGFNLRVDYKTYELTIGAGKFATFYDDNDVKLDDETPAGVGTYTITNIDADRTEATVSQLTGNIAVGTPMLVYNGTAYEQVVIIKVTPDGATSTVDAIEQFKGTAVDREFTDADMQAADYYALSGGQAFARVRSAGTLSANQCWLQFDKQQVPGARSINLVFEGGQTTGITSIGQLDSLQSDNCYDLQGRRVAAPTKGLYIQSGKKVVK